MAQGLEIHDGAVTDLLLERRASGSQASVSGVLLASGAAGGSPLHEGWYINTAL